MLILLLLFIYCIEWDENTFHICRQRSLNEAKNIISEQANNDLLSITIIDDLMQLRSMRREIYVMTRDTESGLLVVWVDTTIDVAITRNNCRQGKERINPESIQRIHAQLQPPDSSFIFDRAHIVVNGDSIDSQ